MNHLQFLCLFLIRLTLYENNNFYYTKSHLHNGYECDNDEDNKPDDEIAKDYIMSSNDCCDYKESNRNKLDKNFCGITESVINDVYMYLD